MILPDPSTQFGSSKNVRLEAQEIPSAMAGRIIDWQMYVWGKEGGFRTLMVHMHVTAAVTRARRV